MGMRLQSGDSGNTRVERMNGIKGTWTLVYRANKVLHRWKPLGKLQPVVKPKGQQSVALDTSQYTPALTPFSTRPLSELWLQTACAVFHFKYINRLPSFEERSKKINHLLKPKSVPHSIAYIFFLKHTYLTDLWVPLSWTYAGQYGMDIIVSDYKCGRVSSQC